MKLAIFIFYHKNERSTKCRSTPCLKKYQTLFVRNFARVKCFMRFLKRTFPLYMNWGELFLFSSAIKRDIIQWKRTRRSQFFQENIRALTHIHELSQIELCAYLLLYQSGQIFNPWPLKKDLFDAHARRGTQTLHVGL